MISINLAPYEVEQQQNWYLLDLITILIVLGAGFATIQYFKKNMEDKITEINGETLNLQQNTKRLTIVQKEHEQTSQKIKDLEAKKQSLENITVSKVARYRPVILLEHLQNLKPKGMWFKSYIEITDKKIIHLVGSAFDNLHIAEFMSGLESTRFTEPDSFDIRSLLYFPKLELEKIWTENAQKSENYEEKQPTQVQVAFDNLKSQMELTEQTRKTESHSDELFPELNQFPTFELKIKYEERQAPIDFLQATENN